MSGILLNAVKIIGNSRLLKLLNRAVKEHYQTNRPFITIVVEQDGNASVHSNMDINDQRISLLEQCAASLKNPTSSNIVQMRN
jgi:hypothetical protein